jgi:hypothetical protein
MWSTKKLGQQGNSSISRVRGREGVPFTVTFQAHGMVAVGQYNLAIHLHAYSTFFFSFNVNISMLPMFLIISSSVPFHAYRLLFLIFCVSDPSLKLQ